jgi:hypothetical protein
MASAALPEAVEPGKKGNVKFAFACAILASMTSILLGYGTDTHSLHFVASFCFLHGLMRYGRTLQISE